MSTNDQQTQTPPPAPPIAAPAGYVELLERLCCQHEPMATLSGNIYVLHIAHASDAGGRHLVAVRFSTGLRETYLVEETPQ